ncbi:hypothetical protein CASFOL_001866 [Castilleja foliolosa]|uniref:Uncharacterized protein n=1 Tax=Castilleja foliolosa TaxID=1961234 RepID=A0ABD3ECM3_9LAMI
MREWVADWVSKNDDVVRSLPIYVGGVSVLAVLFNRTVSSIAPVADASSGVGGEFELWWIGGVGEEFAMDYGRSGGLLAGVNAWVEKME